MFSPYMFKPFIPIVKEILENGSIDAFMQEMKEEYRRETTHNGTVEIMITTEEIAGKNVEIARFVELSDNRVYVIKDMKLTDLLTDLLKKI